MKQMVCEMCGGKDLIKQDGVFVCQNCQAKYSVEEAKKMMVEVDTPTKLENENYEPSPELLNPPENQSTSSFDLGSFTTSEKTEKSFLTKPLAPDGCGCGCLPAVFTSPIFIIAFIVLIVIGTIITSEESQTKNKSNIEECTRRCVKKFDEEVFKATRNPKLIASECENCLRGCGVRDIDKALNSIE